MILLLGRQTLTKTTPHPADSFWNPNAFEAKFRPASWMDEGQDLRDLLASQRGPLSGRSPGPGLTITGGAAPRGSGEARPRGSDLGGGGCCWSTR